MPKTVCVGSDNHESDAQSSDIPHCLRSVKSFPVSFKTAYLVGVCGLIRTDTWYCHHVNIHWLSSFDLGRGRSIRGCVVCEGGGRVSATC